MRLISRLLSLLGLGKAEDKRPQPQAAPKQQHAPETQHAPAQDEGAQAPDAPRHTAEQDAPQADEESADAPAPDGGDAPKESGEKSEALRRFEAMPTQAQRSFMIERLLEQFIPRAEQLPETGIFQPLSLCIRYPGTKNLAFLKIEPDARESRSSRRLIAFCIREGTDMAVNHFLENGPTEKLTAWLRRGETVAELKRSFDELSDSVDDKW